MDICAANQSGCPIAIASLTCFWSDDGSDGGAPRRKYGEREFESNYDEHGNAREVSVRQNQMYHIGVMDVGHHNRITRFVRCESSSGQLPNRLRITLGIRSSPSISADVFYKKNYPLLSLADLPRHQAKLLGDGALACFGDDLPQLQRMLEEAAPSPPPDTPRKNWFQRYFAFKL